jgi:hypothetical protein
MIAICIGTVVLAAAFFGATLAGLGLLVAALGMLSEAVLTVGLVSFTALVGQAIVAYMGGYWILQRTRPDWAAQRLTPLFVGLPILVVVTAIPYLGGVVGIIVGLAALGALWIWGRDLRQPAPAAMIVHEEAEPLAA